ncbi:hypothetical protein D3C72_1002120 [compost metagenome]
MQVGAEHGFHRQLPTGLNLQAFGQTRTLGEVVFFQPFGSAGARIERSLLQGFKGSQTTVEALQITLRLLLRGQRLLQLLTQLFKLFDLRFFAGLQIFEGRFGLGELLVEFHDRRVFRVSRKQRALFTETLLPISETLHAGFQLLDARLLHFSLTARFGGGQVEGVPLLLPAVHDRFGIFQRSGGFFGGSAGDFLLRGEHVQLFAEGQQQRAVVAQV